MSLHDDLKDVKDLARMVMSDKKEEKQKADRERRTVQLVCPYCGTSSRFVFEEGKLPGCPSCGAVFEADDPQLKKLREEMEQDAQVDRRAREAAAIDSAKTRNKIRRYVIIGVIVIVLLIVAVIVAKLNGGSLHVGGGGSFNFHIS